MPTLKQAREAALLTQAELATATGLSLQTIENIEQGRVRAPNAATRQVIQAVFGESVIIDYPASQRQRQARSRPRPAYTSPTAFRDLQAASEASLAELFEQERQRKNEARMHVIAAIALVKGYTSIVDTFLRLYGQPPANPAPRRLARGR